MSEFNLTRIDRLRYRPTKAAETFLSDIRVGIAASDKATVARLAIARSLQETAQSRELVLPEETEMGNAIEGVHLFGDDHDLWACLIGASVDREVSDALVFRSVVEGHWHRGAMLLREDYLDVKESDVDFIVRLANLVPEANGWNTPSIVPSESEGPIQLAFGSVSKDLQSGELVSFEVNAPGTSPHMAIMGKTRSGKSRTGLDIASQIVRHAKLPLIFIDPKGEFVKNRQLVAKPEWNGETLERYFPGIQALDVPLSSIPLDFLFRPADAGDHDFAKLAMAFRDSFQKCIKSRGDVALNLLRETVYELLRSQRGTVSLTRVMENYSDKAEDAGKTAGSIGAKLSEIDSLRLFEPTSAPSEFFSKRWVVSFGDCSDEPKRLAIFLILDALNSYLMSLPDSSMDEGGRRALRHLLVIDEAREILSYKHGALSSLIRKSASKGGITMLLSQGADDFDQEEDDFLEQMGTVGVFALSSANVKNLTGAFGKRMKVEDFSDRSLPAGVAMVKLPAQAPRKIVAWQ